MHCGMFFLTAFFYGTGALPPPIRLYAFISGTVLVCGGNLIEPRPSGTLRTPLPFQRLVWFFQIEGARIGLKMTDGTEPLGNSSRPNHSNEEGDSGSIESRLLTFDDLLDWADSPSTGCGEILSFDFNQASRLISGELDRHRQKNVAGLPPLFWGKTQTSLEHADNLSRFLRSAHLGWTVNQIELRTITAESVSATAQELYAVYAHWSTLNMDSLTVLGKDAWSKVFQELSMTGEELKCLRAQVDGELLPFPLWEADYLTPHTSGPINVISSDIAAWFTLFSVMRVFKELVLLCLELSIGPEQLSQTDYSNQLFGHWLEIQHAVYVADYWDHGIEVAGGALRQFQYTVHSEVKRLMPEQVSMSTSEVRALGLLRLAEWFETGNRDTAGYCQWQDFWMATMGENKPAIASASVEETIRKFIIENKCSYQTAVAKYQKKVMKESFESAITKLQRDCKDDPELLPVLNGKCSKPTQTGARDVVMLLVGNSGESRGKTFQRANLAVSRLKTKRSEHQTSFSETKQKVRHKLLSSPSKK